MSNIATNEVTMKAPASLNRVYWSTVLHIPSGIAYRQMALGNGNQWEKIIDPISIGGRDLEYVARLTQTGTGNPVTTVLRNELGFDVSWVRFAPGFYGAFGNFSATTYATPMLFDVDQTGPGLFIQREAGIVPGIFAFIVVNKLISGAVGTPVVPEGGGVDGRLTDTLVKFTIIK